ncbi:MAG: UvrD-helicase domain-containing protein [Patescibacteria group bacterium]
MSTFVLRDAPSAPTRKIDYAKELNQEQLDVVLHGDGPCLVLAGAGSGKTRTLTYRVAYLLEQGVDPSSILLLTFTNKAAREMLARVESLLGAEARGIWGGTFHATASRILRAFAEPLGYQPNFSILDADDAEDLVKAVMKDLKIDPKAQRFPSPRVTGSIISYSRNVQHTIQETLDAKHPHFANFVKDIEEVARQYQERKKAANVMDFDDLLSHMARLLDDPQYGASISERFRYVLVDEYQDTNTVQARMVSGFGRAHHNVVVVGDDAQSIYAFRGADVKNILAFPKQWPEVKVFKLLTNYRSTPEILEVANNSLSHNVDQFQKDLVAVVNHGDKPKLIPCASASQEARYVAEQILLLRSEGVALRNMAVLFRSSAHSQQLEFELMKRDVPYEYRGGQKFFERAHIKDIVAFLRVAHNPKDEIAWLRVLNLQQGIGATTASVLTRELKRAEKFDQVLVADTSLRMSGRAMVGWKEFVGIAQRMNERGSVPGPMIRGVMESSYQDYLEREYPNWRERVEDLEQLASFAETYQDVGSFLADIALYDEVIAGRERAAKGDDERMVLSTIHQAKGLEWDTVFVIHLADNAFPNKRAMGEEGGLEEERRLFYVAVTRARRQLFLSYPMTTGYDALMFSPPSVFLEELSPRLFERVELREAGVNGHGGFAPKKKQWNWDDSGDSSWEEPTVEVDGIGERRLTNPASHSAWKSVPDPVKAKPKPGSFLREVEDL